MLDNEIAWIVTVKFRVPEEEMFGKEDGAGCTLVYGVSEEDVVGKQYDALRIGSRWPQQYQPCTLVQK